MVALNGWRLAGIGGDLCSGGCPIVEPATCKNMWHTFETHDGGPRNFTEFCNNIDDDQDGVVDEGACE